MLRRTVQLFPAMAISGLIGIAVLLAPCSSVLAEGSNPPNPNSDITPGQACEKLGKATQEYKDCISAQAKSHQDQGKGQQGGSGNGQQKDSQKDNGKGQQKDSQKDNGNGKNKDKNKGKLPIVNP